jgi:hypothetical protein
VIDLVAGETGRPSIDRRPMSDLTARQTRSEAV